MGDSYNNPQQNGRNFDPARGRGGFKGGRGNNFREGGGGFRIRLSDNEMRAARSLQEAFNLRSTVAVLGFALRTLGELLEQGQLQDLINQYQEQNSQRQNKNYQSDQSESERIASSHQQSKPNPFARPAKPDNTPSIDITPNKKESELTGQDSINKEPEPTPTSEEL
tara:strand:- start:510 stop:1010 length:501 start_codon:yes stop_codon:yes gene_type:complete